MSATPRVAAARCVAAVLGGQSLQQALPVQRERVAAAQRPFFQQLVYGGLRALPRSEALLQQLLPRPLKDKDRDIHALLLLGIYELTEMQTPSHAAVSANVEAATGLRKAWAKGLVNAALRRYLRERDALAGALDPAAAAAYPRWLWDAIGAQWPEHRSAIVAASNSAPPMCLRLREGSSNRAAYLAALADVGIGASPCLLSPVGVRLDHGVDVGVLPGFADGLVSVQDEAAQLAAPLLAPAAGERILDACAAPGGKACHLAELAGPTADIVALDHDPERLTRVADNARRLRLALELRSADATAPPPDLGTFDRILADVPCSATGVLRRNPDIKVLRRPDDIAQFAALQTRILMGLWPLLRPQGRLLYVTCSILHEENDDVISALLHAQHDARLVHVPGLAGEPTRHGQQLLPAAAGPDGLYFCLLEKVAG